MFVFLWAKGHNASAVCSEMHPMYGDKCFTRPAIHAWCTKFAYDRESVDDKKQPSRHVVVTTDARIATIYEFVRSDGSVSVSDIVHHTGISRDSVHRLVYDHLKFWKVCARWMPKQLMPGEQATRMVTSLNNLQCYKMEREALLERNVTGDEMWVHCYQPESEQASKQWKHKGSPTPTKFNVLLSAKRVMATVKRHERSCAC